MYPAALRACIPTVSRSILVYLNPNPVFCTGVSPLPKLQSATKEMKRARTVAKKLDRLADLKQFALCYTEPLRLMPPSGTQVAVQAVADALLAYPGGTKKKRIFCYSHPPALGQSWAAKVRTALPTPPRFTPPTLARRADIHRYPGTTPIQGRCECGSLLGRVPWVPSERPAVGTATAGLGALLPGPTPTRCDCPSVRAGPRVRGRCLGFRAVRNIYRYASPTVIKLCARPNQTWYHTSIIPLWPN